MRAHVARSERVVREVLRNAHAVRTIVNMETETKPLTITSPLYEGIGSKVETCQLLLTKSDAWAISHALRAYRDTDESQLADTIEAALMAAYRQAVA